ncbi:hypothetical protein BVRB_026340 [Beta vulgaris subsp. vulgaris]|uniref:Uncharacterized protein n=1 Tax=Beta vulgaris subsp. vulgaris TaxID=3555 RepID=A0A0J8AZ08_BETVV|nr:hypothetical protein BVRB_026340 [Beta vulgaris subsp. vulgaris]
MSTSIDQGPIPTGFRQRNVVGKGAATVRLRCRLRLIWTKTHALADILPADGTLLLDRQPIFDAFAIEFMAAGQRRHCAFFGHKVIHANGAPKTFHQMIRESSLLSYFGSSPSVSAPFVNFRVCKLAISMGSELRRSKLL